jgi:Cu(I)/Ag(I) efflux system membrane fusion protein
MNIPDQDPSEPANSASTDPSAETTTPPASAPIKPHRTWDRIRFLFKVVEIRLRFVLIFVATFILIGKWDTIKNYWSKWSRPANATAAKPTSDTEFFCPMHPSVVRESLEPDGSVPKCPICGMPLSQRKKGEAPALPNDVLARVQLSPERIQMAGVQTAEVAYQPLAKSIRAVGFVDYDQSRLSKITTRVSGYIEKLFVDRTFMNVQKGEPLAILYSPELFSTVQELDLALRRGAPEMIDSGKQRLQLLGIKQPEIDEIIARQQFFQAITAADAQQIASARARLKQLGIGDSEIEELERTKRVPAGLTIRSPAVGHVIAKNVEQGDHVEPGATLFEIADLSQVWVEADVFEKDISLLQTGQRVEITTESLPNQPITGKIILVHPHLETATRTDRIRIELPNPGHALRPGMFATVKINVPFAEIEPYKSQSEAVEREEAAKNGGKPLDDRALIALQKTCPVTGAQLGSMGTPIRRQVGSRVVFLCCPACIDEFDKSKEKYLTQLGAAPNGKVLVVPEAAVIDTGSKKIVYVEDKPGQFDGVSVELGPESDGFYPVVQGLHVGQRVAAAGAFLVDAETRLNPAAGSTYIGAGGGPQSTASKPATN